MRLVLVVVVMAAVRAMPVENDQSPDPSEEMMSVPPVGAEIDRWAPQQLQTTGRTWSCFCLFYSGYTGPQSMLRHARVAGFSKRHVRRDFQTDKPKRHLGGGGSTP